MTTTAATPPPLLKEKHAELGERIRVAREAQGLTRTQLAQHLKANRHTIGEWERGASAPNAEHCVRLADALGITLDFLLRDSA